SSVPMAANSLTSPAPVAPTRCPGSISARPAANPSSASVGDSAPRRAAATTRPKAVIPSVSTFGMRRVYRSTRVLESPLPATALTATGSEILSNVVPEDVGDRLSQRGYRSKSDERDQGREQPVLEQVLGFIPAHEATNRGGYLGHVGLR